MKKELIKIAYNTDLPFFNLKDGMPDMDTIEAILIQTFLEKHNLSATWDDAGGSWGSRGQNGSFNGVVGKVQIFTVFYHFLISSRLDILSVTLQYQSSAIQGRGLPSLTTLI